MEWVLDCSMAMSWLLPDEDSERAVRFLGQVEPGQRVWVPPLWWFELANALTIAERRGRLTPAEVSNSLALFGKLTVLTDWLLGFESVRIHQSEAEKHHLSAYDSAYLELARRKGLGLATLDERLAAAAVNVGVEVFS